MSDPTDDINKAFDASREVERLERDESIDREIDTTDRIVGEIAKDET